MQPAIGDRKIGSGWNSVDMLDFDGHPVDRLQHLHPRMGGEKIRHQTFMGRVEMLNEDERHSGVGRQRVQKPPAGIQAAGRCTDPNNGKPRAVSVLA